MSLAAVIGWFMTRVILGGVFYLLVTPISLLSRLSGKRFLDLKLDRDRDSYWNYRQVKNFEQSDYEKQF